METTFYKSPIGILRIASTNEGLCGLAFEDGKVKSLHDFELFSSELIWQLDAYFNHKLKKFDIPLDLIGSQFQLRVWKELQNIPFGQTISYMELAKRLGDPKSIRAVAHANAKNPVAIIIPCHRVIGSDGSLTGYAGGLWRKKWLLEHERYEKQTSLF